MPCIKNILTIGNRPDMKWLRNIIITNLLKQKRFGMPISMVHAAYWPFYTETVTSNVHSIWQWLWDLMPIIKLQQCADCWELSMALTQYLRSCYFPWMDGSCHLMTDISMSHDMTSLILASWIWPYELQQWVKRLFCRTGGGK